MTLPGAAPWPPWTAEWIRVPWRLRAVFGGETVADSRDARLLRQHGFLPAYYFPERDIRLELLEQSDYTTRSPYKGTATYQHVRVGEHLAPDSAWTYRAPLAGSPDTRGYWSLDFHSMDAWYEEDEQLLVHPRDAFVRVDALPSSRHVTVEVGGRRVAETRNPVLLFETELVTRVYVPPLDVRLDLLRPSAHFTLCPYKGRAGYYDVIADDTVYEQAAWSYPTPLRGVHRVAGHIAFWNERPGVSLTLDGEPVEPLPLRRSGDGGELLFPSREHFPLPPPASMRGAQEGARQHDFARPNGRAEGPPDDVMDMDVERAGGRRWQGADATPLLHRGEEALPSTRRPLGFDAAFTFGPSPPPEE